MYHVLLPLHALFKWLVVLSLSYASIHSFLRYRSGAAFTRADNAIRHWTATIAHVQLILGMAIYTQSPLVRQALDEGAAGWGSDAFFFKFVHSLLMLTAIGLVTVGSALAKRKATAGEKFRTMLLWYGLALLIILLAIPWPFSPLAQRPFIRTF